MLNTIYTSIIISDYYSTTRSARADNGSRTRLSSLGSWCSTDEPYLRKRSSYIFVNLIISQSPRKVKSGLPVLMLVEILCRNWISTIPLERSQTWRAPDQSGSFHGWWFIIMSIPPSASGKNSYKFFSILMSIPLLLANGTNSPEKIFLRLYSI